VPAAVFAGVVAGHFLWLGLFPEQGPAASQWVQLPAEESWLERYVARGDYWLGYSYALALAFAAWGAFRYRRTRSAAAGRVAIGGAGLSGVLALTGCWLLGCCGSPLLPLYLSIFGGRFLAIAKPLVAALTTISVAGAWVWLRKR
jgi:hypothetical protein